MKHANIAKTLGWVEVPDNQEGLFLQPVEADAIDSALGNNAQALAQVTSLTNRATTAESSLATANTTIANLETEIETLKKGDAGEHTGAAPASADSFGSNTKTAADFNFQKTLNSLV